MANWWGQKPEDSDWWESNEGEVLCRTCMALVPTEERVTWKFGPFKDTTQTRCDACGDKKRKDPSP